MSHTPASVHRISRVRQIFRTPLLDLLRGRLIDPVIAIDFQSILAACGLPLPITDLVADVIRRTRLWRSEKSDVASELVSHFAEGLHTGVSPEEILANFGDPRRAARLIRRAKLRNRSLSWHVCRFICFSFLAICLFYGLLAVYYYSGKPAPSVDYIAQLNQPILATPVKQRAWPLYRQVILDLSLTSPAQSDYNGEFSRMLDARPGSKRWPALQAWLVQHRADIDLLHRAADQPQLGFVLGPGGSADDPAIFPGQPLSRVTPMYDVAMPILNPIREFARILSADAEAACDLGDRVRFLRDMCSLFQLTNQTLQHPSLVAQLVSAGIRAITYDQLGRALSSSHVSMFTDIDLRDLAHQLIGPQVAADLFDLNDERIFFHDIIQHMYTISSLGGGHLTPQGFQLVNRMTSFPQQAVPLRTLAAVVEPASLILIASRDQILHRYDHFIDQAQSLLHQPLRQADWATWNQELNSLKQISLSTIHNYPIGNFLPSFSRTAVTAERCLGLRDGLLCAIALESYRRHHDGHYPASLDALTPSLLPSIPVDRITGGPVHYILHDNHPIIYSLGDDHIDNQGTPPIKYPYNAAQWNSHNPSLGDWILYPDPSDTPRIEN
ncbi:MAG TPA: hypothetical protein VFE58_10780 [Tepidisphaeraceae bacterium]|jgi:hypothetical protein|nr:hypothetical protein [Tepidisphaeraceae bacterium]